MNKTKSKNRNFKKRKLIFLTTAVLGIGAAFCVYEYNNKEKVYYDCEYSDEPHYPEDKFVWKGIVPEATATILFSNYPSDTYIVRAFKGKSEMTHYRTKVFDDNCSEEYSEWKEIPTDGLIKIDRKDFSSDNQYGKDVYIQYGKNNNTLDEITEEESFFLAFKDETYEEVEYFNNIRKIMVENFRKIIREDDIEFDKVKKAYDFIIKYIQYNHDPHIFTTYSGDNYINSKGIFYTDCVGYTDIINCLLNSVGVQSFSVIDDTNGHIWNIVKVDGKYYHLDATYSDTGSFTNTSKYRYFLVSDDFMQGENRWFVKEKDVECSEDYDLSGVLTQKDIKYRNLSKSIKK